MVVETPKYYNPSYWDSQKGTPNLGKPPYSALSEAGPFTKVPTARPTPSPTSPRSKHARNNTSCLGFRV